MYEVFNYWVGRSIRDFHGYKLFLTLTSVHRLAHVVLCQCHWNSEVECSWCRCRCHAIFLIPIDCSRRTAHERCPCANIRSGCRTLADSRGGRCHRHFLHRHHNLSARSDAVRRCVLQRHICLRYGCHRQVNGCWLAGKHRFIIVGRIPYRFISRRNGHRNIPSVVACRRCGANRVISHHFWCGWLCIYLYVQRRLFALAERRGRRSVSHIVVLFTCRCEAYSRRFIRVARRRWRSIPYSLIAIWYGWNKVAPCLRAGGDARSKLIVCWCVKNVCNRDIHRSERLTCLSLCRYGSTHRLQVISVCQTVSVRKRGDG